MYRLMGFFLIILSACDSPLNHKTDYLPNNKNYSQKLNSYQLNLDIQWIIGPNGNLQNENQLLIISKNSKGLPENLPNGLEFSFYSTMPSMGHPLDDPGYFENIAPGIYLNQHIRFNMEGQWQHEIWVVDRQFNMKEKIVWQERL